MSTDVDTVSADESAESAYTRMRAGDMHHLVVLDGRAPVGIVSERDLGGRNGVTVRRGHTVQELMTSPVFTAQPDWTLRQASKLLRGHNIGCLPVLDKRKLVGIVTLSDVLDTLIRGVERPMPMGRRRSLRTELGRWKGTPRARRG
jgi:acetoin utilization protein AcuB